MDQSQANKGPKQLPLSDMADRHRGLSPALAAVYSEAASVCLSRHHSSPVEFTIRSEKANLPAIAEWSEPDDALRGVYANQIDTTEFGACGCAIAAVELAERLFAVRRAETLTGADYYLAPEGRVGEDLEDCLRLEVSGTDKGNRSTLERLLFAKAQQAKAGKSTLPAIAAVVGFQWLSILIRRVTNE